MSKRPFRIFLNRLIFRGFIFGSGLIAIALFPLSRSLGWRFVKMQARNLGRHSKITGDFLVGEENLIGWSQE